MRPSIPSGMRDFSSEEVYKRQYIFNTIRTVFEKYGYQPIETPTMENLSTLEGKYGEEGDRLLYRVLNSGDFLKDIDSTKLETRNAKLLQSSIAEKGLRYDLTVPFARYVVMHQNEITLPFKRYQIQPVYRADRPQKGRYREFFQCDADVVGSDSLLNEVELIQIYDEVFSKLKFPVQIKINNRKVLVGIAEMIGAPEKFTDITIAIDKLDKMGMQQVMQELQSKGLQETQLGVLQKFFKLNGENGSKFDSLKNLLKDSETGQKGIQELSNIFSLLEKSGMTVNEVVSDFSLARGLNYYTGTILEVLATSGSLKSSLGGGGRYDDLTGIFGLKNVSGVGISFGADRIYDVINELNLFPGATKKGTKVLFVNFDEASQNFILPVLKKIREEGIAAEIYPSAEKLKKQMKYADDKKIPFVVFAGEEERNSNQLTIKNMESGEQEKITSEELILKLKK